jgi:NADH-quinone oxidoreductase subunit L
MNLPLLVLILPLLGSLISAICIIGSQNKKAEYISTIFLFLAALASIYIYINIETFKGNFIVYNWINFAQINLNFSIFLDPLTAIMFCVVTIVSSVVHLFSIGYMHEDKLRARFFCYLSLFTFAMLVLVSADNFIQLFLGWEGVGLCSYLLVGYYFHKPSANNAAIKAFLVNRVGDFGYLIAIALIYKYFNSLNFQEVFSNTSAIEKKNLLFLGFEFNLITCICMFLFMAAVGKSAQIGLHVWLPDAMEGPTPVSALIHAATMVTAGVFLVVRCSPIFEYSQFTLNVITYVGLITSLFAASVALLQNDIKKVIAYSTCSQLGYMFFACGISAYSLAMFHLVTHAFFKALLFLGAGCVIHCLHHEQDCKKMGGLYKKLPVTFAFIIIGSIALMGIPPFAGYFSKDLILEYALSIHSFNGTNIYVLGCLGAFLTSVYSTRLIYLTFLNKTNIKTDTFNKIKEPSFTMLFPLFILSIGAIAGGYLFYDIVENNAFWFNSIFTLTEVNYVEEAHHIEKIYKLFPIFLVVLAVIVVFAAYKYVDSLSYLLNYKIKGLVKFLQKKWYFDEIYGFLFVTKLLQLSTFLWTRVDINLIDLKGPIGVSNNIWKAAAYCRKIQNGKVFSYAIVMFTGIVVFVSLIFFN